MGKLSKQELLSIIRRAKSSHIRWRAYAQGLVSGVDVDEDRAPVSHISCKFGQWYYGQGQEQLGGMDVFINIEGPHEMLHGVYEQIHTLVGQGEMGRAREKLDELIGISRTLLEQIEILEDEINALPE